MSSNADESELFERISQLALIKKIAAIMDSTPTPDATNQAIITSQASNKDATSVHVDGFAGLYSGAISVIHSYLLMSELLRLSRVSHHFRRVAIGSVNPTGMYRLGKEIPFVAWDIISHGKQMQSSSSSSCPPGISPFLRQEVPNLLQHAEKRLVDCLQQRKRAALPPMTLAEHEAFIAQIPAVAYGAPPSARHVKYCPPIDANMDVMFLSPIVGRHVQQLSIEARLRKYEVVMLALRFPFLQSLSITIEQCNSNRLGWQGPSNAWKLPSQLRSLTLKASGPGGQLEDIIKLLPTQCPMLQELDLTLGSHSEIDLSPLLSLPHLTRLSAPYLHIGTHASSAHKHAQVLQQLTQVKSMNVGGQVGDTLSTFFPATPNKLEEFALHDAAVEAHHLEFLAEHAPQLRVLEVAVSDEFWMVSDIQWNLVDHSVLKRFCFLHTLRYGQKLVFKATEDFGQECIRQHGSLEGHVDHVISVFAQLPCLTNLTIENFYTPIPSRSVFVNKRYFNERGMNFEKIRESFWHAHQRLTTYRERHDYQHAVSSASLENCEGNAASHWINSLSIQLSQLVTLSLASMHLPSLTFLANLPYLQSFSLSTACFLPIESLYDLHHASSTLTRLNISDCFPTDTKGRAVYLLHDVLQVLQWTFPITAVARIQFPSHLRKYAINDELHRGTEGNGASLVLEESTDISHPASSSTASITPRHSSWQEVRSLPSFNSPSSAVLSLLQLLQRLDKQATEETLHNHPLREQAEQTLNVLQERVKSEVSSKDPFRLIFDSFTVHAPFAPCDEARLLTSRLLPRLRECTIEHREQNLGFCRFTYDQTKLPFHRLNGGETDQTEANSRRWKKSLERERLEMEALYGLRVDDSIVEEIFGHTYNGFLDRDPPNERPMDRFSSVQ